MSDRSTRWQFTAYERDYPLLDTYRATAGDQHELIAEIGWQDEICPNTQKKHRQGYVRTVRQVRFTQIKNAMGTIHLEKAKNWEALKAYCKKEESRDPSGEQVAIQFERPLRLHEMLVRVADSFKIQEELEGRNPLVAIDRQTDRHFLLRILREHSKPLVLKHPEYATVLVRQDARDAWCDYIEVWLEKAAGLGFTQ